MSTSTPILASVPYSTLPRIPHATSEQESRNVDDLLDELDSESDSGYDEANPEDLKSARSVGKQPESSSELRKGLGQSSIWFRPLVDGPPLCQSESRETESQSSSAATAPAWTKWTSSRVMCTDTALSTNEDKLECVWLLAGCEDGTVWIFCSVFATTNTSGDETGTTTPRSRAQSELHQSHLRTSADRPSYRRQKSDMTLSRKPTAVPSSPSSAASRAGGATASGFAPSRVASTHHSKKHVRTHGGSISLAVQGSASPSHNGSHTPVGRKASATISITDLEALGNELTNDIKPPERATSPPMRTSIAGMSFEELSPYEPIDHRQINFEPIAQVYPRASHSPIVSIKLLPQESYTSPFVCLTANGQLFKFAVRDGMVIDHLDLGKALFPRSTHLSLADCRLMHSPDPSRLIVKSNEAGLLVPIEAKGLQVSVIMEGLVWNDTLTGLLALAYSPASIWQPQCFRSEERPNLSCGVAPIRRSHNLTIPSN